jgi:hypothetical protein
MQTKQSGNNAILPTSENKQKNASTNKYQNNPNLHFKTFFTYI